MISLTLLLVVTGLILSLWHGWSAGLPRMLIEAFALLLGLAAAWIFYGLFAPLIRPWIKAPDLVLGGITSLVVLLLVFGGCNVVAMIFLKSTKHHRGFLKFLIGSGGAVIGVTLSAIIMAGIAVALHLAACVLEGGGAPGKRTKTEKTVIAIAKSIKESAIGPVVEFINPSPPDLCANVRKLDRVFRDPDRIDKFFENPEAKTLFSDPKLMILLEDDDLRKKLQDRDLPALLADPNVIQALNDPAVREKLFAFDWTTALDKALAR